MTEDVKKEKDLESMTVKELKTLAAEETDLAGVHAMKKAELLAAIKETKEIKEEKAPMKKAEEAKEIKEEEAPKKKAEKVEKAEVTVKGLKEKVVQLEKSRQEARDARDKRMVDMLRRRINRAKKRMRKLPRP